jgi:hypothetical protein
MELLFAFPMPSFSLTFFITPCEAGRNEKRSRFCASFFPTFLPYPLSLASSKGKGVDVLLRTAAKQGIMDKAKNSLPLVR